MVQPRTNIVKQMHQKYVAAVYPWKTGMYSSYDVLQQVPSFIFSVWLNFFF